MFRFSIVKRGSSFVSSKGMALNFLPSRCMTSVVERKRRKLRGLWNTLGNKIVKKPPTTELPFSSTEAGLAMREQYRQSGKSGQFIPRAHEDTKYMIDRREFKKQMSLTRKAYQQEYQHQVNQLHEMEAVIQKRVQERRLKKKEKRAKQIKQKEEEMAAATMREAVNAHEKEDKSINARAVLETTERAKSLYALGILQKEKQEWINTAEEITEDVFATVKEPVGFTPGPGEYVHEDSTLSPSAVESEGEDLEEEFVDEGVVEEDDATVRGLK